MGKITTLLFDCDNTLVLSEKPAFEACADLMNEICTTYKIPIPEPFTGPSLEREFVGMNCRGMLGALQQRYNIDIPADKVDYYVDQEMVHVISKLKEKLQPCVHVDEQLAAVQGKYKMAMVSSSAGPRLKVAAEKVGHDKYFPAELQFSAATSLPTPTSKPNPAIYLFAMEQLGVKADECVAIEDSKSGTGAGHNAGIKVIGYTGPYEPSERAEKAELLKSAGACIIMEDWNEFPAMLAKIEAGEV